MVVKEYDVIFKNSNEYIPKLKKIDEIDIYEDDILDNKEIGKILDKKYSLSKLTREKVYLVTKYLWKINGVFEISIGNSSSSVLDIREIFIRLALVGATSFILYHNHSSRMESSSEDDENLSRRFYMLGEIMDYSFEGLYIVANKKIIEV